jgi:peptidoglycan/LPS O-acetylase OafA/YrhL
MPAVLLVAAFSGFLGPHYHLFRSEYFLVGIFIYQIRASDLDYIIAPVFLENRAARILFVPVCLAIMMLVPSYLGYLSGNAFFVLLACGALVFAASYDNLLFPKGRWTGERLRWIGDRSYSFYLSHIAALLLVYELTFRCTGQELKVAGRGQALVAVGAAFVLTLLFATASWRWLEKPMQRRGRQRSSDYLQRLAGQSPR